MQFEEEEGKNCEKCVDSSSQQTNKSRLFRQGHWWVEGGGVMLSHLTQGGVLMFSTGQMLLSAESN